MSEPSPVRPSPGGHDDRTVLVFPAAPLLHDQRRRWEQGERITVEAYLAQQPGLAGQRQVVLDLLYNEILLREQEGEQPRLEEYLQRFPHLADDLAVQFEVDNALDAQLAAAGGTCHVPAASATERFDSGSPPPEVAGYEILEVLGRGGMGVVYKARHVGLNRLVALKMVLAGGHAGPQELARFRTEAEAVARLQHPNIVQVYEIGARDGRPYIALELVDGSVVKHLAGTPLPPRQAAQWLETLARAVHHAHQQGIVHRDLKPANLLLSRHGVLKITDFGLAKILADSAGTATQSGAILGTPSYMAPEQAEGKTRHSARAVDVYGLGAILYEFLTGRPPFRGATVQETLNLVRHQEPVLPSCLQHQVPHDLETICLCCLHKEPARRYPSAQALAEDLGAFLAGEPIRSRRPGWRERLARWTRRRPAELALVASALMALVGLVVGMVWSHPLAAGAAAALSLVAGSWWYNDRLRRALREVAHEQQRASQTVTRLHLLLDMTRRLMRTSHLDGILRLLAETTVWLANAESATIYLLDRERRQLWSKVVLGSGVGEIRLPLGVGLAGTVALTGEPINIRDAYADPRFNPAIDLRTGRKTRSLLTLPLTSQEGTVLGVFQVLNKQDGAFDIDDINVLSALAASAAIAIEQALSDRRREGQLHAGSSPKEAVG